MDWVKVSDTLFMISICVVVLSIFISGVGPQGYFPRKSDKNPGEYEAPRKEKIVERQDQALQRLKRSKLLWAGVAGVIVSVIIAQF